MSLTYLLLEPLSEMSLYIVTGPPFSGKKTLLLEAFKRLQASSTFCFMRIVSTRVDTAADGTVTPKPEVDPGFEVAVSESAFACHRDLGRFAHIWADTRPKEPPVYFAIPASLGQALQDGKKVVVFIALPQHRMVISDLETLYSSVARINLVLVNASVQTIMARAKTAVLTASAALQAQNGGAGSAGSGRVGSPGNSSSRRTAAANNNNNNNNNNSSDSGSATSAAANASVPAHPPATPPTNATSVNTANSAASTASTSTPATNTGGAGSAAAGGSQSAVSSALAIPTASVPSTFVASGAALGLNLLVGANKLDDKLALVKKRLIKTMQELEPLAPVATAVNNDGTIADGVAALLPAIGFQGEIDFVNPNSTSNSNSTANSSHGGHGSAKGGHLSTPLATCPPQEYLERVIFPALTPALETLDVLRPTDPVEYLALLLLKQEQTLRSQVACHRAVEQLRAALRAQVVAERIDVAENGRL